MAEGAGQLVHPGSNWLIFQPRWCRFMWSCRQWGELVGLGDVRFGPGPVVIEVGLCGGHMHPGKTQVSLRAMAIRFCSAVGRRLVVTELSGRPVS